MGGTGTSVTNQCKNIVLAVDFLAEAKLSLKGSIKTWTILCFDPIRIDVWSDPRMKADNEYTEYFEKDIFSTLQNVVGEIGSINFDDKYPETLSLIQRMYCSREQSVTPEEALKKANVELLN